MKVISIDLGATSGRVMTVTLKDGKIFYEEYFRFRNIIIEKDNKLYWDFNLLMENIKIGLKKVFDVNDDIESISIDSWAVDYALIDSEGNLLNLPMCYRDNSSYKYRDELCKILSFEKIYSITGIQDLHFNTIYQLYGDKNKKEKGITFLMIPDLIAYFLTEVKRLEITNCSTTSLYNRKEGKLDAFLLNKINVDKNIFPEFIYPTEEYGKLKREYLPEHYKDVKVIAVCSHDTASSILGMPLDSSSIYLSSGTWSLLGTEEEKPIINEDSLKYNFTNEIGFDNTIRFLKNTMGMFLINEVKNDYENHGNILSFDDIKNLVLQEEDCSLYIDVDDPLFETPFNMLSKVNEYLNKSKQNTTYSMGMLFKAIYQSMALSYREKIEELSYLTHRNYDSLIISGGGNQADLLNTYTSSCLGIKVVTGPCESTILGNALAQFISLGYIKDKKEGREIIKNSIDQKYYYQDFNIDWNLKYKQYKEIKARK